MYAEERHVAIAQLVADRQRVSVAEIAERFQVTTETARRDLSALERRGRVRRVHGGAVPVETIAELESALGERDRANPGLKDRIARAASALLPREGGSILLDAGSTTSRFARLLPPERELTVATHSVPVAAQLAGRRHAELTLLPGRVRPTTQAAVGADTVASLARLRVDVCFVGTNGVSLSHGLTTPDPDEAAVKHAMVRAARRVVALADSSKLGVESMVRFADLSDVDVLVTDDGIDEDVAAELRAAGVEVVVA